MSSRSTLGVAPVERPNRAARRHPTPNLSPAVLDRIDTAAYLSISPSKLAELTAAGRVPSLKLDGRRLYRRSDLDGWLAAMVTGGGA